MIEEIVCTKEEAMDRQQIVPAWMRSLDDGRTYTFIVALYPWGRYWLNVKKEEAKV